MTAGVRAVVLTERRAKVCRLRRADADDLLRHFRPAVDVTPTFDRGVYRVTARGVVGWFRTAGVRWEVRPKLPWDGLRWLAGGAVAGPQAPPGDPPAAGWGAGLADLLAGRLADLMRDRAAAGLVRDYVERETEDATVRGRIDFPRQARHAGRGPGLFDLVTDEFSPDVVWNRAPKAAARRLLAAPGLAADVRARLAAAVAGFDGVADAEVSAADLDALRPDRRTEGYRLLVRFCRLLLADPASPAAPGDSLLINLEHLFQEHVGDLLGRPGALPPGRSVEPQAAVELASQWPSQPALALRPDLLVRGRRGDPVAVWDVKWKALPTAGPAAADVHQVLGYAAALGVETAGLIYPGRRWAAGVYRPPAAGLALRVVRLPVVGSAARRARGAARLAGLVGGG